MFIANDSIFKPIIFLAKSVTLWEYYLKMNFGKSHFTVFKRSVKIQILSRTNEWESLFQCKCICFLGKQIGMESLFIDWAKEEAKMAKIVLNIHVYC